MAQAQNETLSPRPHPSQETAPALGFLEADSFREAADETRMVLSTAPLCPSCRRVLRQMHERLGSTLFYDDDPGVLIRAFDVADRSECTLRLLAACIVEFGRPRERISISIG